MEMVTAQAQAGDGVQVLLDEMAASHVPWNVDMHVVVVLLFGVVVAAAVVAVSGAVVAFVVIDVVFVVVVCCCYFVVVVCCILLVVVSFLLFFFVVVVVVVVVLFLFPPPIMLRYSIMLAHYAKSEPNAEKITFLLKELIEKGNVSFYYYFIIIISLLVFLFNIVCQSLLFSLLGLKPTSAMCNTILGMYAEHKRYDLVSDFIDYMTLSKIDGDDQSFAILLKMHWARGSLDESTKYVCFFSDVFFFFFFLNDSILLLH
jgi:hypothetical protein